MPLKKKLRFGRFRSKLQACLRASLKRARETPEYKQKRLENQRLRERLRRAAETPEERENRLAKHREYQKRKRSIEIARETSESFENRQKRLECDRLRERLRRAAETPEERENRLTKQREYMRRKRQELQILCQTVLQDNPKERQKRSKQNPPRKRTRQNAATPKELENRIVKDQENNPQQGELLYQSLLRDCLESRAQRFPIEEDLSLKSSASNKNYLNKKYIHCDNTSAFDLTRIKKEPESVADSEKIYVFDDVWIKEEPEE